MSEYVTTIVSYVPKQVNGANGPFTLHKFVDLNNTELVARADVANLVRGYLNQPLKVTVRSEQKGNFLNHYLDHAEPVQAGAPQQPQTYMPAQQAQQAQYANPNPIPPPTPPPPPPQQQLPHQLDQGKDRAIHRQTAAKVAAVLSTTPDEFWRNVADLAYYFDTGNIPGSTQPTSPAPPQQAAGGEYQYTDSDIPFSPTVA